MELGSKSGATALMLLLVMCAACTGSGATAQFASGLQSVSPELASAEAKWQAASIDDYTLEVTETVALAGELRFSTTVTDGEVSDFTLPDSVKQRREDAPTVEDLFLRLEYAGDHASNVTYNDVGVPLTMNVDDPNIADDEAKYEVTFSQL